jgi:hypothetical protein
VGGLVGGLANNSILMGFLAGGAIAFTVSTRRPTSTPKNHLDALVEYYSARQGGEQIVSKLLEIKEADHA